MSDSNSIEIDVNTQIGDSNSNREKKNRKDKPKCLSSTKVIIRRLPPSMDEATFLNQIQPVPEYDYFYFVAADWSLGQNATSRAYLNFIQEEDIFIFKDRFDGYVFVDVNGGVEYPAIVEFAPFQGLPKSKSRKKDNKCNTLESDPHFIQYMTFLNGEIGEFKTEMKMEYSYQIKDEKKITSTPLLEYIASKKLERREERKKKIDERKRQRDDDRNRKKNQIIKAIPASIREQDEDGIIVRVVKSRPRDRGDRLRRERISESSNKPNGPDMRPKSETNRDEKRRLDREQRENRRKEDKLRFKEERIRLRGERDRYRKERDTNKKEDIKTEKNSRPESEGTNKGNHKDDRVKRYSESRRARLEYKDLQDIDNKLVSASDKPVKSTQVEKYEAEVEKNEAEVEKNVAEVEKNEAEVENALSEICEQIKDIRREFAVRTLISNESEKEKSNSTDDVKNNDDSSGDNAKDHSSVSLSKEERLAQRIRNKDRPSLQIYQPKRRMSTKKEDEKSTDDTSSKIGSKPSSPTLSETSVTFSDKSTAVNESSAKKPTDKFKREKPSFVDRAKSQALNEKNRFDKVHETNKSYTNQQGMASDGAQYPHDNAATVQRKVSRYSERRNKMKEKPMTKLENVDAVVERGPIAEPEILLEECETVQSDI